MSTDKVTWLLALARQIASVDTGFHSVLGPGDGDRRTQKFMLELRRHALHEFGSDYAERKVCGETSLAVDFYFPEEETIVEVALGLPNPGSEFEKDVLKAIMAQELGNKVRRLVLSRGLGAQRLCTTGTQGRDSVGGLKHKLQVEVLELDGEPRVRRRVSRLQAIGD